MAVNCPVCGAANEPDESFCGECGVAIARLATIREHVGVGPGVK
jgi:predicted nucleic acid-binding Zn ribbon protein